MRGIKQVKDFHFHSRMLLETLLLPVTIFIVVAGNTTLFAGSYLFYKYESGPNPAVSSFMDALWWGFCTVTTVGYGDVVPVTQAGRWIGIVLMVTGIFFFVTFTAVVATLLVARTTKQVEVVTRGELDEMMKALERIEERLKERHPKN